MKSETLFLKMAVILLAIPVLALCIFGLPYIAKEAVNHYSLYLLYPVIIGMYVSAVPFYLVLHQAFKLLCYIDKNKAFSEASVNSLKHIKYYASIIGIIYGAGMPLFYLMAETDDAPGIIIIGLALTFAPVVIAVFAAVLQKLLKNAIDIKSENDLTI
ncbi:hypothetical protein OXPF_22650 [Oxobacter pfennigii]|uniref:Membrane protein YoaS n=1 Tax=Oxobacter pfennigii TaxID=36849 RepID=A0A0P8W5X4_9CLOT|nr:DUF2975 domain-containing protein [Oxobacter pfennigii]KPU44098.1 hypothetical protein OXPF_22650 [Oxobacter pfennigii]